MADQQAAPAGPDLSQGVALSEFSGETLLGHVGDEDVLLVRSGPEIFAIDAHCSHYHGPLAEGLVVGESIRCPWHHACFDLRTGEAVRAPALERDRRLAGRAQGDRIFVRQKREQPKPRCKGAVDAPGRIVIVGGGAAGFAAAEMLRRQELSRQHRDAEQRNGARPWIGRTCRRIISPAARPRTGCRCARTVFTPRRHRFAAQNRSHIDRYQGAQRRSRRRQKRSLRPSAAGDGCGAGAPADSGRGPAACPCAALAGRLPRDHRVRRTARAARS